MRGLLVCAEEPHLSDIDCLPNTLRQPVLLMQHLLAKGYSTTCNKNNLFPFALQFSHLSTVFKQKRLTCQPIVTPCVLLVTSGHQNREMWCNYVRIGSSSWLLPVETINAQSVLVTQLPLNAQARGQFKRIDTQSFYIYMYI